MTAFSKMPTLDDLPELTARVREHMPPPARLALHLAAPPDADTIACADLLASGTLRRYAIGALSDLSETPDRQDPRIAAQRFFKKYVAAILPASLLSLAHGVAVDTSIPKLRFVVDGALLRGIVIDLAANARTCADRRAAWPIVAAAVSTLDDLRAHAFRTLFTGNLVRAVDAVVGSARMSRRLLWCNVSEQIELLYAGAQAASIGDQPAFDADRDLLLRAETLPGVVERSPLHGTLISEYEPDLGRAFTVREVCCMQFKLRDRADRYCANCGLPPRSERAARRRQAAAR